MRSEYLSVAARAACGLAAVLILETGIPSRPAGAQQPPGGVPTSELVAAKGELQALVVLVAGDLSQRPVAKRRFRVYGDGLPADGLVVASSFEGRIEVTLPEGFYRLKSEQPLAFEGRAFEWDIQFAISADAATSIELSNDNASVGVQATPETGEAEMSQSEVYQAFKDSVFKVISEGGHGSGFLAHQNGLVVTNHHVIRGSEYLAIVTASNQKFAAHVLAEDPENDIAVLSVCEDAVKGLQVPERASQGSNENDVHVGDTVLAIGSPLATDTILTSGIVSKVEAEAIYSDVSINPGNSGGPLFDAHGRVLGISTFNIHGASGGPGVSGIVQIHLAEPLIAEALQRVTQLPPADCRLLPVESDYRFPAAVVREAATAQAFKPKDYHVECGKVDVQLVTPVIVGSLEVQEELAATAYHKKRTKKNSAYEAGRDFYNWRRYAGDYRPVVTVQAIPEISLTGGSKFAVIMVGNAAHLKYRFKTDFVRMELRRGNQVVEPIHPGKHVEVVSFKAGRQSMDDVGVYGSYEYPPEAFLPGSPLYLYVWTSDRAEPKVKEIKPEIVQRVRAHFRAYFDWLSSHQD